MKEENSERAYEDDEQYDLEQEFFKMQKTKDEILEQGYFQNFFECPYEFQEVIFMMIKGDQDALSQSDNYLDNQDIFNHYLKCIIEFSQEFDPTETLMIIANDPEKRQFIEQTPDQDVPLDYIIQDLWPKLGFIDPENPGVILIAEFMLNELILKNSETLDKLNLQHLKELFSGDPDDEDYGDMDLDGMEGLDMDEAQAIRAMIEEEKNPLAHEKQEQESDK